MIILSILTLEDVAIELNKGGRIEPQQGRPQICYIITINPESFI